ncbi:MAG: two-component sensor histidine kinase [Hyphomicrobiales bacterium]|nr:two-component sensor histidine kinase [Hyphomicrobiales bacterium]
MRGLGGRTVAFSTGLCTALVVGPNRGSAQVLVSVTESISAGSIVFLAVLFGTVGFAVFSAIALLRAKNRAETENAELQLQIADLRSALDMTEAMTRRDDETIVAWNRTQDTPTVAGALPPATGAPADRAGFLAYGTWLKSESAARLDHAMDRLRDHGESFVVTLATCAGRLIEVRGSAAGAVATARFRDLSGDQLAHAEIAARHELLEAEIEAMRTMFAIASMPIWLRDETGRLAWVNAAYTAAVGAASEAEALEGALELFDDNARRLIGESERQAGVLHKRLPAIVAGTRRMFDVADVATSNGGGGIAVDATASDAAEAALRRETDFQARTLDQLTTAVAIFGPDKRLKSANAAYRGLFGLDQGFLDSGPDETAVLDRLRAERTLPEQADFRAWRADLLSAYQSAEARERIWHLPDGQTLRVIANPNPQGGMTWVYENVTERLDLESRYNALIRVQGETLDHLAEGVAVFGSDGKLRLHNPAFGSILALEPDLLAKQPHVSDVVRKARQTGDDDADWRRFTTRVAGLDESRSSFTGRMERANQRIIDYATVPLPGAQTMVTLVDVTDTVQVERALIERNEALEAAGALKNAFIHHVSYELRSPLTNIIGFTELLDDAGVGPLNDRQREYVGYISSSSGALLAIVNDILDLATIDAGIMELDLGEVDIAETVATAIDGLRDRIRESRVRVETDIPGDIGGFTADAKRVSQILFNLLANAVAFSPEDGQISLKVRRSGDAVEFAVVDEGPGIPPDFVDAAFDRFASKSQGAVRGGAGLGLAIVKSFVELHGGTVAVRSKEDKGSQVVCRLPARPGIAAAAE